MPPERNLRLPLKWVFDPVDGPYGWIEWRWCAKDSAGNVVMRSAAHFGTYLECLEDARLHGYIDPEAL